MTEHPPPTVVVAVADSIGGNAALPRALRSLVIVPVLEEFRVAPCEVPVGSDAEGSAQAQARGRIESARIVIAEVAGASPEVLLSLGWRRGREAGRTILLAPTTWPDGPPDEKALRYPPSARAVGRARDSLRAQLREALAGDREAMARAANAATADVLDPRRLERLRRIDAASLPLDEPDPLLRALCRGYATLGEWSDVIRLIDEALLCRGEADPARLPLDLLEPYAMALNRRGRGGEALQLVEACLARGDESSELRGVLGRIHKDRWEESGRTSLADLNGAIDAYLRGFAVDHNYYPGINALTLMVFSGKTGAKVKELTGAVRESLERGRNPDEHPWWHLATWLQVEVIARDFEAAGGALDALLAQPSEPWMRESTAQDLARLADLGNRQFPTSPGEVEDSEDVRDILEIRQAVLLNGRTTAYGVPRHCVLEMTRRGGDRWVNFTNEEPRPLFCRASSDEGDLFLGDPVARLQEAADPAERRDTIEGIGRQLSAGFTLDETVGSLVELIGGFGESYLVLQVDERTAVEPWELLAQEPERHLSLETSFARRLWLGSRSVRRRSGRPSRRALVIGDPRDDLPAAREEAGRVAEQLADSQEFPAGVTTLIGSEKATADEVAKALDRGGVDLLHYAGHAQGREGFELADGLLNPGHLSGRATTPVIVVANACGTGEAPPEANQPSFVTELAAVGVEVFLGCAWPVGDEQAKCFSERFYERLLDGRPVGHAVRSGRRAIRRAFDPWDPYWAAYVLYGNPWYRVIDTTP